MAALHWDLFCRVIDNFGDAGVCWRLAAELARRGEQVRLVIDDPGPLAFMAPAGAPGVTVLPWPGPTMAGDVVVEAFGCDPPAGFVSAMSQRPRPPVWVNLEYLSAQAYVERSHGLPSPQPAGLTKWFFFPGFTERTGGLLREPGLLAQRARFDRDAWLAGLGAPCLGAERVVSLFCYDNPAMAALLRDLARQPTLLLLTPGAAQRQVSAAPAGLRVHRLPWLTQDEFDRLLWSCDLNFVRGEDSLVRALWAGAPFVWQIYPQGDGAHAAKLEALLRQLDAPAELAAVWRAWNGLRPGAANERPPAAWPGLPALEPWARRCLAWREHLSAQRDLATQLQAFVRTKATAKV